MTFSIVARDAATGMLGVAVSTAVPCVGALCPYVEAGVGAFASQSFTNVRLGIDGLALLAKGLSPEAALSALLAEDEHAGLRQVGAADARGRTFVYSGDRCVDWYGHRVGDNYTVQGNMLVGKETVDAMAETFEGSQGHLAERLLRALEAGQAAGGDKRGRESAALLVAPAGSDALSKLDIRVDVHPDPVAELRRIFDSLPERWRRAAEAALGDVLLEEAQRTASKEARR
ncbi:MAG: DUF1028 domain-containing protein [Dehalococcoidia bacterium]|nr:DUF1028 domain-containing protein [Dehalococcoidia bacterium]